MSLRFTKKTMPELNRLSPEELKDLPHNQVWVALDSIRSRNNVGSVFRTSDAFRIGGLYLCGVTPVPPHRDIFKTALGATDSVPWEYHQDIGALLKQIKEKEPETKIWAVEQTHNSTLLQDLEKHIKSSEKILLIFGNEVSGVSDEALQFCDGVFEIPQYGSKHSFNISVSVGISLWEVMRYKQQF